MAAELKQEDVKELFSNFLKNGGIKQKSNDIRIKTFVEILISPGIHMRELQRRMNVPFGTIALQANILESRNLVKSVKSSYYTSLYPVTEFQHEAADIFIGCPLRKEIFDYIIVEQGATQKEISGYFGLCQSTARYHLQKLIDTSLVIEIRDGQQLRYFAPPHRQLQT